MIDDTTDLCEEAFANISGGTLRTNSTSVALARRVIVPSAVWVLLCLARTIFDDALALIKFSAGTLTEVSKIILVVVAIAPEVLALVSHAMDLRAVVLIDMLASTSIGVVPGIGAAVVAGVDVTIWPAEMTALAFTPTLELSEDRSLCR